MRRLLAVVTGCMLVMLPVTPALGYTVGGAACYDGTLADGSWSDAMVYFDSTLPGCDGSGIEPRIGVLNPDGALVTGPWLYWWSLP